MVDIDGITTENRSSDSRTKAADVRSFAQDLLSRRTIRRDELRKIVPLAATTIYELERRGEFPRRFNLTPRCVVWDLAEVLAWIEERRQAANTSQAKAAPAPNVRRRKHRPVKAAAPS